MPLSTKRKIILWVTVLLVVVFLGLNSTITIDYTKKAFYQGKPIVTINKNTKQEQYVYKRDATLYFYNFKIGRNQISFLGSYKYQLIVATFLIGLALFMTVKTKT